MKTVLEVITATTAFFTKSGMENPRLNIEHLLAHGGRTGLVTIGFDGQSETALMKGIQRDPRSGQIVHVDFQAVSMTEEVTSSVPVRFIGESESMTLRWGEKP